MIRVNEAFRPQRVTGQQRYATEIADRLLCAPDATGVRPSAAVGRRGATAWAWTLAALPLRARRDVLLSLTSRAPLGHPHHVVTVHDLFVLTNPEWYSRGYVRTHAPVLRTSLRGAAAVLAVSEPVAAQVRASGLTSAAVTVVPNAPSAVFGAVTADDAAAVLARHGLAQDGYLLTVGSRDPRKNLRRLIDAHAQLGPAVRRAFPLVVVGGGHAAFGDEGITLPADVLELGYVSDAELAALYGSARAVVFPSLDEGFGLPIVEAAAAGARLVASDIPAFTWIAGGAMATVDPRSTSSIRAGLERVVDDIASVPLLDVAEMRTRFDWDRSAATALEVCRSVAETRA